MMWDASKCDLCGDCLVRCRYVDYDRERAAREIKLLMEGKAADILEACITCNACVQTCPTGADPADLIYRMQEKTGASPIVAGFKPFTDAVIKGFAEGGPNRILQGDADKPVLSLDSFSIKQFPDGTVESRMFKGMTVVRGVSFVSLVGLCHMGGASLAARYAQKVIEGLAAFGKDIVYLHNEGYVLAHVKAKELGIDVPYRYLHLFEYLLDYLKNNAGDITPLNRKIAYQPNCAVRWIPHQDAWLDEIFNLIGVKRVSRKYEGVDALCCGGPALAVNRELAAKIQNDNIQDAMDNRAEAMITICPMCDVVLGAPTAKAGLPKIFITDLCRMALGEASWPATAN
ncbi:MAG: (Fe-S)-binding protein [Smithellaceae bacterium]|nr:(Fe-S)-binding protein [Smithellaceae bacterium]